jgi:DNA polymerase IV
VETLPVGEFHGVGPVTAARMNALGIHTGLDLRGQTRAFLAEHFGKAADYYCGVARGQDDRPVEADRIRKSIGAETTFERDLTQLGEAEPVLESLSAKVWSASTQHGHAGRSVTVTVNYADFRQITRSRSRLQPVGSEEELRRISLEQLRPRFPPPRSVRLLGVTISNLEGAQEQSRAQMKLGLDLVGLGAQ